MSFPQIIQPKKLGTTMGVGKSHIIMVNFLKLSTCVSSMAETDTGERPGFMQLQRFLLFLKICKYHPYSTTN